MYRLGRIDLIGEWMQRVVWTRDRDFRFLHAWLSNIHPHIVGEAVSALGKSSDPALVPLFSGMLTAAESLPMRLRIIDALAGLGLADSAGLAIKALDARLHDQNYLPYAEELAVTKALGRIGENIAQHPALAEKIEEILQNRWDGLSLRKLSVEEKTGLQTNLLMALSRAAGETTLRACHEVLATPATNPVVIRAALQAVGRARLSVAQKLVPDIIRREMTEQDEKGFIAAMAEASGQNDGREELLPLAWLTNRLRRSQDKSDVIRILGGHEWSRVRPVLLGLLDGTWNLSLREANILVELIVRQSEYEAVPKLIRLIRFNPESELVPLWMQGLAKLGGPDAKAILNELARQGLPGVRLLAKQLLQSQSMP